MEKGKVLGIGCIIFSTVVVAAMAITLLALNNEQLYGVTGWCASLPGSDAVTCVALTEQCWASSEPLSDMTPCKYLYAVGAIGLLFQVLIGFLPCMDSTAAMICMAFTGVCNFGWWIAAAIYFTVEFKDVASYVPAGNYRDAVLGVTWTAFGMTVVQLLSMGVAAATARKSLKDEEAQYNKGAELPTAQPTYASPVQA